MGAATAAILSAPYAISYTSTKQSVGTRPEEQVLMFSARPSNYTLTTASNYLYGKRSAPRARLERVLFPGVLSVLLGVTGLLLVRPTNQAIMYLLGLVAAFEMSLGFYGYTFPVLYEYVPIYNSLRAPARLGIFVVFFLAILAAKGHAAVEAALPRRLRPVLLVAIAAVLVLEYWVAPLRLMRYPNDPPALYAWLRTQPRGVVAEFPMPRPEMLPGVEPRYIYMSTFHWMPLVNGYSGYFPLSYLSRLEPMRPISDDAAVDALLRNSVRYVIVHPDFFGAARRDRVLTEVSANPRFTELGRFDDGLGTAVVYRIR
jgi:hypothetical protein